MRNALEISRGGGVPTWNELDHVFDRMLRHPFALFEDVRRPTVERWARPEFDVNETDQAFLLSIDLPGLKRDDIKVDVSENVLTVSGERKDERGGETSYRRFQRSFTLPATVDVTQVEAHLEDGVLRLALPKAERAKPRSVEVKAGQSGFFSKLVGAPGDSEKH